MTRVAAVVLDMDGLMLDTEPIYKATWQQAAAELGCDLTDAFYLHLFGRRTEDCERELVAHFGPRFDVHAFRPRWLALWRARAATDGLKTKPGLDAFLSFVESRQVPMAVATSTEAAFVEFCLRQAGLAGRLPLRVTGDQVAHGKPAPDVYLEAARRLGVEPRLCVALEDSDAGTMSASRAGMMAIQIPDLKPPSDASAAAAFRVLPSLDAARQLVCDLLAGRLDDRPL
jgi:HAD superfamily hydrolase (TIGR01509 family)